MVINKDISEFSSNKKYDLIISISTFEHTGQKEKDKTNKRLLKAIKNLNNLLKKDEKIYLTFLIGYNPYLDNLLINKRNIIYFYNCKCFEEKRKLAIVKLEKRIKKI